METSFKTFSEELENSSSDKIIEKIRKGELKDILGRLCFIKENSIILNYIYFKYFATNDTYNFILNYITNIIDQVLLDNNYFIVHLNMKNLTIIEIDKHKLFIQNISVYLKEKYPQKLAKCYVYNAPFIFTQIFSIVSMFINKDTQKKIELVNR
jgi:hypothetical protein